MLRGSGRFLQSALFFEGGIQLGFLLGDHVLVMLLILLEAFGVSLVDFAIGLAFKRNAAAGARDVLVPLLSRPLQSLAEFFRLFLRLLQRAEQLGRQKAPGNTNHSADRAEGRADHRNQHAGLFQLSDHSLFAFT